MAERRDVVCDKFAQGGAELPALGAEAMAGRWSIEHERA
jgi:hypothetical protein